MYNNITFKVALPGEGKTKWLLNVAKRYLDEGRNVLLFTEDDTEYQKFCEKYFNEFKEICHVQRMTAFRVERPDVVLVDNLLKNSNSVADFKFMQRNCYKMFVTLEGITSQEDT